MRLSEAVIIAMNDIDESLLKESEEEVGFTFTWKPMYTAIVSFVLLFAIILPVTKMVGTNNSMKEAESESEFEYTDATAEEAAEWIKGEVTISDSLKQVIEDSEGIIEVVVIIEDGSGIDLKKEVLEKEVNALKEEGYDVYSDGNRCLMKIDVNEIDQFAPQGEYSYYLDIVDSE